MSAKVQDDMTERLTRSAHVADLLRFLLDAFHLPLHILLRASQLPRLLQLRLVQSDLLLVLGERFLILPFQALVQILLQTSRGSGTADGAVRMHYKPDERAR